MNLEFTPIALALVLPSNSVAGNADGVASSYRQKSDNDNTTTQQRDDRFKFTSNANGGAADGRKLDLDVGLLGRRRRRRDRGRGKALFPRRRRAAASNDNNLRFLEGNGDDEDDSCASQDSCEPTLCQCVDTYGNKAADCADELHALCNGVTGADGTEFTIEGCVSYPNYYRKAYCPFVECLLSDVTFEKCDCAFYDSACSLYLNNPDYKDDKDVIQNCAADACCKTKTDDEGRATCFEKAPSSQPSMMPSDPTKSPTRKPTPAPAKAGFVTATEPTGPTPAGGTVAKSGAEPSVTSPSGTASNGSSPDSPADVALAPPVDDVPATDGQTSGGQASGGQANDAQNTGEQATGEKNDAQATGAQASGAQASDPQASGASPTGEGAPVPPPVSDSEGTSDTPAASAQATLSSAHSLVSLGMVGVTASFVAAITFWYTLG